MEGDKGDSLLDAQEFHFCQYVYMVQHRRSDAVHQRSDGVGYDTHRVPAAILLLAKENERTIDRADEWVLPEFCGNVGEEVVCEGVDET
jgi:hypothetical protein